VTEEVVGFGAYERVLMVLTCDHLPSPDRQYLDREREQSSRGDWRQALRDWSWDRYEDIETNSGS